MSRILFSDHASNFEIEIKKSIIHSLYSLCEESYPNETGGILIGEYTSNYKAHILIATGAPQDSSSGESWFYRGTDGLQQLLDQMWETERAFYLGEWHFHPNGIPCPSSTDIAEMRKISVNKKYNCPEPILLIVGGAPNDTLDTKCFIFISDNKYKILTQSMEI